MNSLLGDGHNEEINKISWGIQRWRRAMFKKSLHKAERMLEIGRQRDGDSCGIFGFLGIQAADLSPSSKPTSNAGDAITPTTDINLEQTQEQDFDDNHEETAAARSHLCCNGP